jgi:glycosyltransferase involved in cell wall biosynthesis
MLSKVNRADKKADCRSSTPRLRVLFITPWYPNLSNPYAGVFVRNYALALRRFCDVVIIHLGIAAQDSRGPWGIYEESDPSLTAGVPCYRVLMRGSNKAALTLPVRAFGLVQALRKVRRRHGDWDVVHAHVFTTTLFALPVARFWCTPLLISEHFSIIQRHAMSRLQSQWLRWCCQQAHAVLPVSHALKQAMEEHGVQASFQVVPNTVDVASFYPPPTRSSATAVIRLISVVSLVEIKGVSFLLNALAALPPTHTWHLDIIGDGPEREALESLTASLGISACVTFQGVVQPNDVANCMKQADLFVLASLCETFSVATAEALCSGLPVVVTRCGGPEDFVDESCGRLVEAGNASAMTEALIDMFGSLPNFNREAISRKAVARFSHHTVGSILTSLYQEAITPKRRQPRSRLIPIANPSESVAPLLNTLLKSDSRLP